MEDKDRTMRGKNIEGIWKIIEEDKAILEKAIQEKAILEEAQKEQTIRREQGAEQGD